MRFALPKASIALLALACACAVGAVPAQAYKHTAGPFWTINGAKLGAGESHEVLSASSSGEYSMSAKEAVGLPPTTITCKKQTVEKASITGGTPSTIEASFHFSECTVTENGANCKVTEPITTEPLTGTLGYATKERTGKILARFDGKKKVFVKVQFTDKCTLGLAEVSGSFIAEISSGGKTEEVGSGDETSAKVDQLRFPATPITAVWVENAAGELKEEKAELEMFSNTAVIAGTSELELSGLPEWGIEAKHNVEGPFWVTKGVKLGAGESHEVLSASSAGEYSMIAGSGSKYTITCKKQAVETASITGGIPSTIKATLRFSECAVKGNGSECKVPEPLTTEPLTGTLGYATNEGTGKILARFEGPGGLFIRFDFSSGCSVKALESSGALVAEIVSGGKAAEVNKPHEAKVEQLRFPETAINTLWVENEKGELKEKAASMMGNGANEEIAGTSELELSALPEWGVEA